MAERGSFRTAKEQPDKMSVGRRFGNAFGGSPAQAWIREGEPTMSSNRLNEETALDKNACIRFGEGVAQGHGWRAWSGAFARAVAELSLARTGKRGRRR